MPSKCVFPGCHSGKGPKCGNQGTEKLSFFGFPKDEKRRADWLQMCGVTPDCLPRRPILCSKHFFNHDIMDRGGKIILKTVAVPKPHQTQERIYSTNNPPPLVPIKKTENSKIGLKDSSKATLPPTLLSSHERAIPQPNGAYANEKELPVVSDVLTKQNEALSALRREAFTLKKENLKLQAEKKEFFAVIQHESKLRKDEQENHKRLREEQEKRTAQLLKKYGQEIEEMQEENAHLQREVSIKEEEKEDKIQEWREEYMKQQINKIEELAKVQNDRAALEKTNAELLKALKRTQIVADRRQRTIKAQSQQLRRYRTLIEKHLKLQQAKCRLDEEEYIGINKSVNNNALHSLLRRWLRYGGIQRPTSQSFCSDGAFFQPSMLQIFPEKL